jgi:hypothetical protein
VTSPGRGIDAKTSTTRGCATSHRGAEGSQGSHARSAAHSGVTDVTLQAITEKALHSGGAKTQRTVTDLPCKACEPGLSVEEAAVSVLCCSCLTRARRAGLG